MKEKRHTGGGAVSRGERRGFKVKPSSKSTTSKRIVTPP